MESKTLDRGKSSGKSSGNSGYDFSNKNDFNKLYNRNYEKNNHEKNNYEKNSSKIYSGSGDMRSRVHMYGPKGNDSDSVEGEVVESQILELDQEIGDTIIYIFMSLL